MPEQPSPNRYTPTSFSDLWRIVRRRKSTLLTWIIFFGMLAAVGASLRPVSYETQASFLDRGAQAGNLQGTQGILGALAGLTTEGGNQVTVEIFKSQRLLQALVKKHSLHASLVEVGFEPDLFLRFQDNLAIEQAYWRKEVPAVYSLPSTPLLCTVADYAQELPAKFTVRFDTDEQFTIQDGAGAVAKGRLGVPVSTEAFNLTLYCPTMAQLSARQFTLTLTPPSEVAEELVKRLDAMPHRECTDLILLTLQYPNRQLVSTLLNDLMEGYRDYLREQNKELADGQLDYLAERKRSATEDMHKMLSEHAVALAEEVNKTGILSAKAEINHLGIARAKAKQDLLQIDSELRLLEKINPRDPEYIKTLGTATNLPHPIAAGIKQIQTLNLRRDSLQLALNRSVTNTTPIPSDLEGIDLEMANRLYLNHAEKLNTIEVNQRQNNFILDQLKDPTFEVSSISGAVQDGVTADIIKRSAHATLELKETDYRSQREQERTRKELAQEREFLIAHLTQTNHLQELQKDFLREKIRHTQEIMLRLIDQELAAANRQLADFVAGRALQLLQERAAGLDTVADIRQQMVQIPKVWASEVLLEQISTTNSKLAEEVSKLVETKNIAHNLEVIQSGPLDRAMTPISPRPPYIALITLLGMFTGGFLSTLTVLFRELVQGVPASRANLPDIGLQAVSEIPKRPSHAALKNLFLRLQYALFTEKHPIVLALTGSGPDYTIPWAATLKQAGRNVLRLETKDLARPDLKQWLKTECSQYDAILAASSARADSIEGKMLIENFNNVAISIYNERLQDLEYLAAVKANITIVVIH